MRKANLSCVLRVSTPSCIMAGYVQDYSRQVLAELLSRYDVDGMKFGGSSYGFLREPCYCAACRKAYADATGKEIPTTRHLTSVSDKPIWVIASYFYVWPWWRAAVPVAEQKVYLAQIAAHGGVPMVNLSGGPPAAPLTSPRTSAARSGSLASRIWRRSFVTRLKGPPIPICRCESKARRRCTHRSGVRPDGSWSTAST
jgi:hypothetical protein